MSLGQAQRSSPAKLRQALTERLAARRGEIEAAILTRVYSLGDPGEVGDPGYAAGLREAVAVGVSYGLNGVETFSLARAPQSTAIPPQLITQARDAARNQIPLDTVLRRYLAGYTLLGDFIAQAAEEIGVAPSQLQRALRDVATQFDRLLEVISAEHAKVTQGSPQTVDQRRYTLVRMLLNAELVDRAELGYRFDAWHVAVIVKGIQPRDTAKRLAALLDRRLLLVCPDAGTAWGWLGGAEKVSSRDVIEAAAQRECSDEILAVGEPGEGEGGWRLSHRQARATLSVLSLGYQRCASYTDIALVAAMLQDEVLVASLPRIYLDPLRIERDGGKTLRQTLRAYFSAEGNASSAAAELGISRRTVANRLRLVEELIERPLGSCGIELEAALRLDLLAR